MLRKARLLLYIRGERRHPPAGDIPRGQSIAVAIARGGQLLLADHVLVLPVPHFHRGRIVVGFLSGQLLQPLGDSYIDLGAIVGPLRRARGNNAARRVHPRRARLAEILPREHGVALAVVGILLEAAQRGQVVRFLAPRQRRKHRRPAVQNAQRPRLGVEHLDRVAGAPLYADRDRERRSVFLPRISRHIAECGVRSGGQVADGERGPRRIAGRRVAAAPSAGIARRRISPERQERRIAGKRQRLHVVDGDRLSRGQLEHGHLILNGLLGLLELVLFRFGDRGFASQPARIGGECRARAECERLSLAAARGRHTQFVVLIGTPDLVRQPLAVR